MSYVGQYIFNNESTSDALSIITPGKPLTGTSGISGLEVIIHDAANLSRIDYLTDAPDISSTYSVFLILWDPADGITLNNAGKRMMQIFAGARLIQTVSNSNNEHLLVQNIMEIPNNAQILI